MNSALLNDEEQVDASKASRLAQPAEGGGASSKLSCALVALLLALIVATAAHYSFLRVPNLFEKKARLIDTARRSEVVVLGSSHAMFAFRPDTMSRSATNLANISQSLEIDDRILTKVFSQPTTIKLVVIPVSYFSIAYNLTSNPETEFRDPLYSIYMGVHERNAFEAVRDPRYWNLAAFYATLNQPLPILGAPSLFDAQIDKFGWAAGQTASCPIAKDFAEGRVKAHHLLMHNRLRKQNRQAIEHMIAQSRQHGAKVLLVITPVTSFYSSAVKHKKWEREVEYLASLAVTTSPSASLTTPPSASLTAPPVALVDGADDVRFANYHEDPRFGLQDFADPDHMNQQGAARFTKMLEQEFITPMLVSQDSLHRTEPAQRRTEPK